MLTSDVTRGNLRVITYATEEGELAGMVPVLGRYCGAVFPRDGGGYEFHPAFVPGVAAPTVWPNIGLGRALRLARHQLWNSNGTRLAEGEEPPVLFPLCDPDVDIQVGPVEWPQDLPRDEPPHEDPDPFAGAGGELTTGFLDPLAADEFEDGREPEDNDDPPVSYVDWDNDPPVSDDEGVAVVKAAMAEDDETLLEMSLRVKYDPVALRTELSREQLRALYIQVISKIAPTSWNKTQLSEVISSQVRQRPDRRLLEIDFTALLK